MLIGCFLALFVTASAEPLPCVSGPQVGSTVPGQFTPLNLNGPHAGDEHCLYCTFGNAPVVMVFARKPTPGLAKLIQALEAEAARQTDEIGVCVVLTDTTPQSRKELGRIADDANLKRVIVAVIDAGKVKDYELSGYAEATVLMYSKKVVRQNFAFRPGELTDDAITRIATAARTHLTGR